MQLNARLQSDIDDCLSAPAVGNRRQHPVSHDYEARRCHCCGALYPAFGFGPPLTRPGDELWVCGRHRGEIEQMLTEERQPPADNRQRSLL